MLHLGSAYFLNVGWGMHGRTGVSGLRMLESNVGWGVHGRTGVSGLRML
jgi:hypothetical protein